MAQHQWNQNGVSHDEPDPMTRAHARETVDRDSAAARKADGLHKLRKGRDSCTATRRDGEQCRAPVVQGTLVCRRHGGGAPQVKIRAKHTQLLAAAYSAHVEWQEARGTASGFDALCNALQAQRALDAYEAKLDRLAELRAEIKRLRRTQQPREPQGPGEHLANLRDAGNMETTQGARTR